MRVSRLRIRSLNDREVSRPADYVLYWMVAYRRTHYNFALDHAMSRAQEFKLPLLVFEPLRVGYRWASARLHGFVLDGMRANEKSLSRAPVGYFPYLEREPDEGAGLLKALAERAAMVVSDDYPGFFIPRMQAAAAQSLSVPLELVDSNGLLPLRATERVFTTAYSFRGYLQKNLKPHLLEFPKKAPLSGIDLPAFKGVPESITGRWPAPNLAEIKLSDLSIDHSVSGVEGVVGGSCAATELLNKFIDERLSDYDTYRNEPEKRATSGLSPHLHFGHLSTHEIFAAVTAREPSWSIGLLPEKGRGARQGWWKMQPHTESFLDELITWREIGFNMASRLGHEYEAYRSLPEWAKQTLDEHRNDPRPHVYSLDEFENASTHDALWNAAQRQLAREGRIHNYLRMLWGKKILEWSAQPEEALDVMVELNNKYAFDGRDPSSYSGIFWVLGRYDRAWGPERPIFGKVRYMSSENTARKVKVRSYLEAYAK